MGRGGGDRWVIWPCGACVWSSITGSAHWPLLHRPRWASSRVAARWPRGARARTRLQPSSALCCSAAATSDSTSSGPSCVCCAASCSSWRNSLSSTAAAWAWAWVCCTGPSACWLARRAAARRRPLAAAGRCWRALAARRLAGSPERVTGAAVHPDKLHFIIPCETRTRSRVCGRERGYVQRGDQSNTAGSTC